MSVSKRPKLHRAPMISSQTPCLSLRHIATALILPVACAYPSANPQHCHSFVQLPSQFPSYIPTSSIRVLRTKLVKAQDEDWLVHLEAQNLRLNQAERLAVDLDQTLALLAVGHRGRGLLLAEALDALSCRHPCDLGRCVGERKRRFGVCRRVVLVGVTVVFACGLFEIVDGRISRRGYDRFATLGGNLTALGIKLLETAIWIGNGRELCEMLEKELVAF